MNKNSNLFSIKITKEGLEIRGYEGKVWVLLTSPAPTAQMFIKRLKQQDADWFQIHSFWVHDKYRGMGVGNQLMEELQTRMDNLDVNLILRVRPYDQSPLGIGELTDFYAKHGFMPVPSFGVRDKRATRWMVRMP